MPSFKKLLKNPAKIVFILDRLNITRIISDRAYLKLKFKASMNKKLDLRNPKMFNEKLQWIKLNDRNPKYTAMVDKYEVKKYVAEKIGEEHIIPTLGVWNNFDDIDFNSLPDRFVLKCTHDSGGVCICKDKTTFDINAARKKLNRSMRKNYYYTGREWPYKNVKPRIIAEQYMEDEETAELRDYKIYTFNGVSKIIFIASERQNKSDELKLDFFDMDFNHLPVTNGHPNAKVLPQKPKCFDEMRKFAEILSEGIPHLRVDFYEVNGKIYFGELTFFDGSGFVPFSPEEWDYRFGEYITII